MISASLLLLLITANTNGIRSSSSWFPASSSSRIRGLLYRLNHRANFVQNSCCPNTRYSQLVSWLHFFEFHLHHTFETSNLCRSAQWLELTTRWKRWSHVPGAYRKKWITAISKHWNSGSNSAALSTQCRMKRVSIFSCRTWTQYHGSVATSLTTKQNTSIISSSVCDALAMLGNATLAYSKTTANDRYVPNGHEALVKCLKFEEQWLELNQVVYEHQLAYQCVKDEWTSEEFVLYDCIDKRLCKNI